MLCRTTLARWRAAQVIESAKERRPYLASECKDLPQAEKWRMQILREIAKKVAQIQNGGCLLVLTQVKNVQHVFSLHINQIYCWLQINVLFLSWSR